MKDIERRQFLGKAMGLAGLISLGCSGKIYQGKNNSTENGRTVTLKGKQMSAVTHWDIITIGNLSRNRYWGESEERSLHPVICTCTIISGKSFHVLVDPSLSDEKAMAAELKRRTGLAPDDIDVVFITHDHGDHHEGLAGFPKSRWLAGSGVASILNSSGKYHKIVEAAENKLFDAIDVIPTPGHTPGHHGLRFDYNGLSVFVAGDSVATKDFWDEGRMYFKALDMEESKRTMNKIASISDMVVPGHDNYFFCR